MGADMFDSAQLAGFVMAVAVLVLVPGPNTMLILAHSLGAGRRAGLATVLGVETATLVHTGAGALGFSAVLSTSALAFEVLKYVGAGYLIFLGLRALLGRGHSFVASTGAMRLRLSQAYGRAFLTNVLNPKVALFFLALLPQFVNPERGHIALQFFILGFTVSAVGLCFGSALAVAAAAISDWLGQGAVVRWQERLTGSVLFGLGVRLAFATRN